VYNCSVNTVSVPKICSGRRSSGIEDRSLTEKEKKMSYHTLIIVGNLGRDPEMRYTPNGQAVTDLSVASNRKYTGSDGNMVKETVWFRVSVWGKQAETVNQYLRKGSQVLIEGRLNPDSKTGGPKVWQGQNGPGARYEVVANTVRFLSGSRGEEGGYPAGEAAEIPAGMDDNIPF
jgi:single-strand DNA-binding protein